MRDPVRLESPDVAEVNAATMRVVAEILGLASRFPHRASFELLDELAQRVQTQMLTAGYRAIKACEEQRKREAAAEARIAERAERLAELEEAESSS